MSRSFSGSGQYLLGGDVLDPPANALTISCWAKPSSLGSEMKLVARWSDADSDRVFLLAINASSKVLVACRDTGDIQSAVAGATSVTTTDWHNLVLRVNATSLKVYLNGVEDGTVGFNNNLRSSSAPFKIGAAGNASTHENPYAGLIAEVGVWFASLDAAEIATLAKGVSPALVRPNLLEAYLPLYGKYSPETDRWGGAGTLTVTGATAADHCRVYLGSKKRGNYLTVTSVPGGGASRGGGAARPKSGGGQGKGGKTEITPGGAQYLRRGGF